MKMHSQPEVSENDADKSCPPTPTPRRRSKSRSNEPKSPLPPRRLKKLSCSGSVDSKIGESPLVRRRELESTRKPSQDESAALDSSSSGISKRRSRDYSDISSTLSKYDNYNYRDPSSTSTSYLLSQSKNLHDRKREFMNERVSSNNPYMKRMLNRESREDKMIGARSVLNESRSLYSPTTRTSYDYPSGRLSPPAVTSPYYTPSSRYNTASPSTYEYSSSTYAPSSTSNSSFMNYFRRSPQSPPKRDAREGCIIS